MWSCPLLSHHSLWPSVSCRVIWYVTRTPWIFREPSFSSVQRLTSVFSLCLCELPPIIPSIISGVHWINLLVSSQGGTVPLWGTFTVSRILTLPKSSFTALNFESKRHISKTLHKQNPSRNIQGHVMPCSRIIALYPLGLVVHERTGTREFQFCCWLGD